MSRNINLVLYFRLILINHVLENKTEYKHSRPLRMPISLTQAPPINLKETSSKFCKHILNLNSSTPNYMVYGELGRYPLAINVKVRMITFWANMIYSNILSTSLCALLYKQNSQWVRCVKGILDDCGLSYI